MACFYICHKNKIKCWIVFIPEYSGADSVNYVEEKSQLCIPPERKYLALCLQLPAKTDALRDLPRVLKGIKMGIKRPQGQSPHPAGSKGVVTNQGKGSGPFVMSQSVNKLD